MNEPRIWCVATACSSRALAANSECERDSILGMMRMRLWRWNCTCMWLRIFHWLISMWWCLIQLVSGERCSVAGACFYLIISTLIVHNIICSIQSIRSNGVSQYLPKNFKIEQIYFSRISCYWRERGRPVRYVSMPRMLEKLDVLVGMKMVIKIWNCENQVFSIYKVSWLIQTTFYKFATLIHYI